MHRHLVSYVGDDSLVREDRDGGLGVAERP